MERRVLQTQMAPVMRVTTVNMVWILLAQLILLSTLEWEENVLQEATAPLVQSLLNHARLAPTMIKRVSDELS